jgi:hyperosmotically inducible periplasmic protein
VPVKCRIGVPVIRRNHPPVNFRIQVPVGTGLCTVSNLKTEVDVKDGIVTLHGQVSTEAQKELTTEYVKDVEGVKSVKNDMAVEKTKNTTVEKVGDFIDDASITAQVKLALLFHRSTNVIKTKVDTKNSIVTVSGEAKNSAEKELVGKLVKDINGVKSLRNKMTIENVR